MELKQVNALLDAMKRVIDAGANAFWLRAMSDTQIVTVAEKLCASCGWQPHKVRICSKCGVDCAHDMQTWCEIIYRVDTRDRITVYTCGKCHV